ncbi:MAG TPA: hypothetical protein VNA69_13780 [Thermoanaerobaculia bacterium]|nr:hypothetical protein [Thermoanaerobaculia bacterium]
MSDWRKWVFYLGGLYDAFFGIAFFFFWERLFATFHITPPNHPGYAQFPALLLVIFGLLFFQIARDPEANRDLIIYGIALKAAYSGLVLWYRFTSGVPELWVRFAWIDIVFLILFFVAWQWSPHRAARTAES